MAERRFWILMVMVLLFSSSKVQAETSLTWKQSIKEAENNNRDLKVAEQAVKAADDTHMASLGQCFPQISCGTSLGRSAPDSTIGGAFSDPNYTPNATIGISAQENLFS